LTRNRSFDIWHLPNVVIVEGDACERIGGAVFCFIIIQWPVACFLLEPKHGIKSKIGYY